ncbi:hypothetical protein ACQ4M4_14210 [Leptolyngbya sp. AN02str]|uniref:hypothetical protein n=1 Tax=Leptolyngbya sp. AN02str TaxID=3423363 RepID=UPI003D31BDC6
MKSRFQVMLNFMVVTTISGCCRDRPDLRSRWGSVTKPNGNVGMMECSVAGVGCGF